jgi:hypothetical protein
MMLRPNMTDAELASAALPTSESEASEVLSRFIAESPEGGWLTNALCAVSYVRATKAAKRKAAALLRRANETRRFASC